MSLTVAMELHSMASVLRSPRPVERPPLSQPSTVQLPAQAQDSPPRPGFAGRCRPTSEQAASGGASVRLSASAVAALALAAGSAHHRRRVPVAAVWRGAALHHHHPASQVHRHGSAPTSITRAAAVAEASASQTASNAASTTASHNTGDDQTTSASSEDEPIVLSSELTAEERARRKKAARAALASEFADEDDDDDDDEYAESSTYTAVKDEGDPIAEGTTGSADQEKPKLPIKKKRPVCWHYLQGTCMYGDKCTFSHEAKGGEDCYSLASGMSVMADGGKRVVQTLKGDRPKVRYMWQLPQAAAPEVVLTGESNAGKSTLMNTIICSMPVASLHAAPVSWRKGRTRSLNWYPFDFTHDIGWTKEGIRLPASVETWEDAYSAADPDFDPSAKRGLCLVDCFGMGTVAYDGLKAKRLQAWGGLLSAYLTKRKCLNTVCHLVSAENRGTLTVGDKQIVATAIAATQARRVAGLPPLAYCVIMTKCDLFRKPQEEAAAVARLKRSLAEEGNPVEHVVKCSSMNAASDGLVEIQSMLQACSDRGWGAEEVWEEEMKIIPKLPPNYISRQGQRRQRENLRNYRVKKGVRMPGGKGARTMLPPRV
eukprot:TRINITY_DN30801_c0_g1_i3.p1 TRINITY_DN30801_c0_g1~~TRINITY_DN30801_c0_g1_i3.p1  ORF type:complete len:599 (+),score=116.86 TRINITY_DN30801_c0_g1_i3:45-1841(+)